ncbi:DgyrCDS9205 [Dimorphilus gyrociliatus]|uniref:DgyrCDS9205 n=1 Tax=Dimorphilus gyrociliatus TaxID=2664684 RepID=A0A7I8VYI8_9ANNE|nr:DgyrCDS9205 [Dimorphilus gyrociliatus]
MIPSWEGFDDWVTSCQFEECLNEWIAIDFRKEYDILDFCIKQKININQKKLELVSEEMQAQQYTHEALMEDDKIYTNVADSLLGATCHQTSFSQENPCSKTMQELYYKEWTLNCAPDCIGQSATITFAYPTKPDRLCIKNRIEPDSSVKQLKVTWSSLHVQFMMLKSGWTTMCLTYNGQSTTTETSVRLEILQIEPTNGVLVGFGPIQIYGNDSADKKVYAIDDKTNYAYPVPALLHNNFTYIAFRVKGQLAGFTDDCSSLSVTFTKDSTILNRLLLDQKSPNEESLLNMVYPTAQSHKLSHAGSLVDCDEWNDFWFEFTGSQVKFGIGDPNERSYLQSINFTSSVNLLKVTEIEFQNTESPLINNVQILRIGGRQLTLLDSVKCKFSAYYNFFDQYIFVCVPLHSASSFLQLKVKSDQGTKITIYNPIVIKTADDSSRQTVFSNMNNTENEKSSYGHLCHPNSATNDYTLLSFDCQPTNNFKLKEIINRVVLNGKESVSKQLTCHLSFSSL